MRYICPSALTKGDTIGLVTPSSPILQSRLESGISYLKNKGLKVKLGNNLQKSQRFLAGSDEERAEDIMSFFMDEEVKGIMATGGGYGSQRILPLLNYDLIRANPKWVTGFSDTTALQSGLLKKAGLISCSGFVFGDLDNGTPNPSIEQSLMACLANKSFQITEGIMIQSGIAQGPLVGGNLESLISLMGTPYQPDFSNCILLIEDVGAEPYQVDSRLSQLALAGVYEQIAGIVFGQFTHCNAKYFPNRDGTVEDVINEWSSRVRVPCIKEFPYGHMERRYVLPLGKTARLNADSTVLSIL